MTGSSLSGAWLGEDGSHFHLSCTRSKLQYIYIYIDCTTVEFV